MHFFNWISACISLTTCFYDVICAAEDPRLQKLRINILNKHNEYRNLHSAPPLSLDDELNKIAQSYAEELFAQKKFEHSQKAGLGENLWASYESLEDFMNSDGVAPVDMWYSENYKYPDGGDFHSWGHFTQVVWKGSNLLGIGIAGGNDGGPFKVYVVANYKPPGNYRGQYDKNVQAKPNKESAPKPSTSKPPNQPNSWNAPSDDHTGVILTIIMAISAVIVILITSTLVYIALV